MIEAEAEWYIADSDTLEAKCNFCGVVRPVKFMVDPLIAEICPEEKNEPSNWCRSCWERRHDKT